MSKFNSNNIYAKVEQAVCNYFDGALNINQKVGVAWDFESSYKGVNYKFEVKYDAMATKTGQIYVELYQTFDNWKTARESGFYLARQQADYIVYVVGTTAHIVWCEDMDKFLSEYEKELKPLTTKGGANGNRPGSFSSGLGIRLDRLEEICHFKFDINTYQEVI